MVDWLFHVCVNFLDWLGRTTGLTYVEISVVFNLWVQGSLLVISALIPFIVALVHHVNNAENLTWVILTGVLVLFYTTVFCWILVHYGTSFKYAFNLCVNDLFYLANLFHTSYYVVNIVIFIVGWLAAVGINMLIAWSLLK